MTLTQAVEIVRIRPPRARVAVAFSTKDRTALTRVSAAPLLEDGEIDLYWFDGSATAAGQALARELCAASPAACALHLGVIGGPDCAIVHALETLRPLGYDMVFLVENDVLLDPGWLAAVRAAIADAEAAGFRVAGASARIIDRRVLSYNETYCLLHGSGAGMIGLTPEAIDIVLGNYRTADGEELIRHFAALTGRDVTASVQYAADQACSADCLYDLLLYLHGFVVAGPAVSHARNIAAEDAPLQRGAVVVTAPAQHLAELRSVVTRPQQIRVPALAACRFQQSRYSPRLLVGCQALDLSLAGDRGAAVRLEGNWRPCWSQMLGPFALAGSGRIRLPVHGASVGVMLHAGDSPAELLLSGPRGYRAASVMPARTAIEFALDAKHFGTQAAVVAVLAGEVRFIGVTAEAGMVGYYARGETSLRHLSAQATVPDAAD